MKKLQTKVDFPKSDSPLKYSVPALFMGSCFSQNISEKLKKAGYPVLVDPFGISFNPISIAQNLDFLLTKKEIEKDDLFLHQGLYSHHAFHSSCSHPDAWQALELMNQGLAAARKALTSLSHIYITFGTAWIFKKEGMTVNNCHKLPTAQFSRSLVDETVILEQWNKVIEKLRKVNPTLHLRFTLSPVRHWKDGAEGNSLSKAMLRLAIHKVIIAHRNIGYIPAYEFMMDECRDYRFYADDLLHPSSLAIDLIWERFRASELKETDQILIEEHLALAARKSHRSLFPDSAEDQRFKADTLKIEAELEARMKAVRWAGITLDQS